MRGRQELGINGGPVSCAYYGDGIFTRRHYCSHFIDVNTEAYGNNMPKVPVFFEPRSV